MERAGLTVATAESLTCGNLTGALGRGGGTGEWLSGGIVAYLTEIKQTVLGGLRGGYASSSFSTTPARCLRSRTPSPRTGRGRQFR